MTSRTRNVKLKDGTTKTVCSRVTYTNKCMHMTFAPCTATHFEHTAGPRVEPNARESFAHGARLLRPRDPPVGGRSWDAQYAGWPAWPLHHRWKRCLQPLHHLRRVLCGDAIWRDTADQRQCAARIPSQQRHTGTPVGLAHASTPAHTPTTYRARAVYVFMLTASCSLFAYFWMIVIVSWWTPGYVTVEEGVLTFLCFPGMLAAACAFARTPRPCLRCMLCTGGARRMISCVCF